MPAVMEQPTQAVTSAQPNDADKPADAVKRDKAGIWRDARGVPCRGQKMNLNKHPGAGNPYIAKASLLRAATYSAVSAEDIMLMVMAQVDKAKKGNTEAFNAVMNRLFGAAVPLDLLEKIAELQARAGVPTIEHPSAPVDATAEQLAEIKKLEGDDGPAQSSQQA